MKNQTSWILISMTVLAMLLSSCGGGRVALAEPIEPQAPAVPEESTEFEQSDLDTVFQVFLANMEQYNTISPEDLNAALAGRTPFLLDVRDVIEAEAGSHISGAVNIPLSELIQNVAYLPSFDTPIVAYSSTAWRSTIALTVLEALGWKEVKYLKEMEGNGSLQGWVREGYPVVKGAPPPAKMLNAVDIDDAKLAFFDAVLSNVPKHYGGAVVEEVYYQMPYEPDLILIDVRTQPEIGNHGVIDAPNLIHVPLEQFIELKAMWPVEKDAMIVTYSRTGYRSTIAMTLLWSYGYTDVRSIVEGFDGWEIRGYPVTEYTMP